MNYSGIADDTVIATITGAGDDTYLLRVTIVFQILAMTAVALRFWSRHLHNSKPKWHDWLVVFALIFGTAQFAVYCWWVSIGGGRYIGEVTPRKLRKSFTVIFITEILYSLCCLYTRGSTLVLWQHLFYQKWIRTYSYVWRVVNALWSLTLIIVSCLQCQPLSIFFNPVREDYFDHCHVNVKHFSIGIAIMSVLLDVVVIALPLVPCWRLRLPLSSKLLICGVFATGFFVVFASGVRLQTLVNANLTAKAKAVDGDALNPTWLFSRIAFWTDIEMKAGIISTCLPCIRPALARLTPSFSSTRSIRRSLFKTRHEERTADGRDSPREHADSELESTDHYKRSLWSMKFNKSTRGSRGSINTNKSNFTNEIESGLIEIAPGVLGSTRWAEIYGLGSYQAHVGRGSRTFPEQKGIRVEQSVGVYSEKSNKPVVRSNSGVGL